MMLYVQEEKTNWQLAHIHNGEPITVTTKPSVFNYSVKEVDLNPDPLPPLLSLTLQTPV
jgi:hypothetical protein